MIRKVYCGLGLTGMKRVLSAVMATILVLAAIGCGVEPTRTASEASSSQSGGPTELFEIAPDQSLDWMDDYSPDDFDEIGERAIQVQENNLDLFLRQPNFVSLGVGTFIDENGLFIPEIGIVIRVTEKVDQSTLPPEDRIPDMIDGVRIQFQKGYRE